MPVAPDLLEQHLSGEHLPGLAGERDKQIELQRSQRDLRTAARHLVGGHVDDDVGDRQQLGGLLLGAAQAGTHPGNELLGLERLDDVIVGTGLQTEHDVDRVGLRREHHDRNSGVGPQHAAYVDAVHAGQHQVQQHKIGADLPNRRQRLRTVADHMRVEPFPAQDDREHLSERHIVVDDQNLGLHNYYGVISPARIGPPRQHSWHPAAHPTLSACNFG